MSRVSQVAKRYAKALFGAVLDKESCLNELRIVANILNEDSGISEFFNSPLNSHTLKLGVISRAFTGKGLSLEIASFLMILAEKGRISSFKNILVCFEGLVDLQNSVTRGTVRSAANLDTDSRHRVESVVSHFIKKKVILSYAEDATLVGGVVAQVAGWTFEDTLDSHLRRLKEDLYRRAN